MVGQKGVKNGKTEAQGKEKEDEQHSLDKVASLLGSHKEVRPQEGQVKKDKGRQGKELEAQR